MSWEELTTEMNGKMQFPGWTNAWTMPIKTRVDMLTTGIRTPIGIKVFGTDLNEVEKVGVALEHMLAPIRGTRSVLYERNLGGLYLDIIPKPDELARYGLRVADVERVIESADRRRADRHDDRRAQPLLDQRPLSAGPAQQHRVTAAACWCRSAATAPAARWAAAARPRWEPRAPWTRAPANTAFASAGALGWPHPIFLAQNMGSMGGGASPSGGTGTLRPRLPSGPSSASDMPSGGLMEPTADDGRRRRCLQRRRGMAAPAAPRRCAGRVGGRPAPSSRSARSRTSRSTGGPPMVRDEAGLLVGYVYVDIDQGQRDIGGYVHEAKEVVAQGDRRAAS